MIKPIQAIINKFKFIAGLILTFFIGQILGLNLILPACLFVLVLYFKLTQKKSGLESYNLLNLCFLFVLFFVSSYFVFQKGWPVFCIPFIALPVLSMLLFNTLEISFLLVLATSISVSVIFTDFYLGLLFLLVGIICSILTLGSRRRSQIIRIGIISGIIQAGGFFFIHKSNPGPVDIYIWAFANGIISTSILALGILPVFEYLFKTVTNISLLELADFNHPLLQRMILEAPGTYHHSLIVGNLSEAACNAIGVNSLLARIGAYYHDIGKLQKPAYFSENQTEQSKHDRLTPTMSKMVIINHVKEGVELAQKHKFNPRLIDFIQQHHGTSLVFYFYRRALENLEEQEIKEEGFRYPGPKPKTKETAIVMLADTVEAAVRSLKEHTPQKIAEVTYKVINNKFIDGQMDACDLTLKDLEKIAQVFIRILSGIYHSRISYP